MCCGRSPASVKRRICASSSLRIQATASERKKCERRYKAEIIAEAEVFIEKMRMMLLVFADRMAVGERKVDAEIEIGAGAEERKRVLMRRVVGHDAGGADVTALMQLAGLLIDGFGQAAVVGGDDQLWHEPGSSRSAQAAANCWTARFCIGVGLMKGREVLIRRQA